MQPESQATDDSAESSTQSHAGPPPSSYFRALLLDDDPQLLDQSYRLRYQVYCLERHFLHAADYPNQLESDSYDSDSLHVGALDALGTLAATARIIKPNSRGLPLFHHCTLFPAEAALVARSTVVEVSRVSISRQYARRRHDPPLGQPTIASSGAESAQIESVRRERRDEPFRTLLQAIIFASERVGATHLIGATDAALHRWLTRYGFPYRIAGPVADYYGNVAPHIMSLAEFADVIHGGEFRTLEGFPVGLGRLGPPDENGAWPVGPAGADLPSPVMLPQLTP